ncbi:insulin-degrading enzyme-like [Cloeon dipterum]|uniref:insulin-degrading enzyme-like n=1 Tax=Cloeon dipterum TaxID=197152 RepID=UPI00322026C7
MISEHVYTCPPRSKESNMLLELFVQIAREPCFYELRTKAQLGYIVQLTHDRHSSSQGVGIVVQSDKLVPYVQRKIKEFLRNMKSYLKEMSDEEFERHKKALAALRLEKPKKMKNLTSRYWAEISDQTYCFDRKNVEVESLRKITKDDVIKFYNEYIHPEAAERRQLMAVEMMPTAEGGAGSAGAEEYIHPEAAKRRKLMAVEMLPTAEGGAESAGAED